MRSVWCIAAALTMSWGCGDNGLDPLTGLDIRVQRGPADSIAVDSTRAIAVDSAGVLVFTLAGAPVAQAFTDTTGTARFAFQPGGYRIQISSCPGAASVPDPLTTEVVPGTYSRVNFLCDTETEE